MPEAAAAVSTGVPAARSLQGPERVAALLLAMGKPAAGRLLKHFDNAELKEVARAASHLGTIQPSELETVIGDFAEEFAAGMSLVGTAQEVEKLLTGILPNEQISEVMSDVLNQKSVTSTVWERTSDTDERALAEFIKTEHPQTVALILSRLRSATSAKVIALLPEPQRIDAMRRMTELRPISAAATRLLESSMHEALLTTLTRNAANDSNARIADILNRMEIELIEGILADFEAARPSTAKALKRLLFRFEDIRKLSAKDRAVVFDAVQPDQMVLAVRDTDAEFRELLLSSLPARARRMVESELEQGDQPEPRLVSDARRGIVDRVMELAGKGQININASENNQE